ncbi:hypothetical protein PVAND_000948 [Polypedilum vanderplanki]|uniref:DNA polymerase alpha subunit B n=1 Tax=Polypedilum vanderplanki TaxID=319348 RepID=A0A9J6BLR9_POLVA|nr:hypothetical protein PVAND_000948 [Polypedilum vanderplanki]
MDIDSLREQFDELGVDASHDVLEKCLEICQSYNLEDPVEFVEKWMAYSISNLDGAEPTVQYLLEMENRLYKNQNMKSQKETSKRSVKETSNLKVYNQGNDEMDDDESELLGSYVCITPKNDKKSASRLHRGTPDTSKANTFSPVSYSPLTTAKRTRIESTKAGNVCTFGHYIAISSANTKRNSQNILISLANLNGTQFLDEKVKYMTTALDDGEYVTDRIFKVGHEFSKKILCDAKAKDIADDNEFEDDRVALSHCDELSQEKVRCLGKIFCGGRTDKLDQKSCIFIGFDENKMRAVQLDLMRLKPSAQIFPGEICIISGSNPRGKTFSVTELHAERILQNCRLPSSHRLSEPINFVIASGPFTSDENLLFEYLDKLIENCQNNKPDVLILTGEFFNSKSKLIFDLATETDEHFRKMLVSISERLGEDTKVVVVSSVNDINGSACYPTRPYVFRKGLGTAQNIFLAPDPCILDINGIKIAVTSVDIIKHLADSEFCMNAGGGGGDKIRRYMNCLFHQKSFYPLFPPKIATDIKLLHEYATINEIPHIFIAPSDMRFFMRDFNGCLCVNPGRVKSGEENGTFARITVQPPKEPVKNLNSWISGQISYL